jgi:hypothetical protein
MDEYNLTSGIRPEIMGMMKPQSVNTARTHATFINLVYKAKEDLHLAHNVQKSKDHSIHTALGDIYSAFDDMIDSFVEAIFGVYGPIELEFSACACGDPIQYLTNLYDTIERERKFFKESWIQNEIDLFQKEIALTLYKLKYVKSNP